MESSLTSWIPKENKTALFHAVTINGISFILNISYVVSEYRPDKWISHTDSVKQLFFFWSFQESSHFSWKIRNWDLQKEKQVRIVFRSHPRPAHPGLAHLTKNLCSCNIPKKPSYALKSSLLLLPCHLRKWLCKCSSGGPVGNRILVRIKAL